MIVSCKYIKNGLIFYNCVYVHMHAICISNQRTNGPVNAHLISWPSKAQNIQNLENIR